MTRALSPSAMPRRYTVQEYFALERGSETKHEFIDGYVAEMSGGSAEHARITNNVGGELRQRLKGSPCGVYSADLRIRLGTGNKYGYADVTVVCGKLELDPLDAEGHTLLNPAVVVGVLSPSTAANDLGKKGSLYRAIASVRHYILIEQSVAEATVYTRAADGRWGVTDYTGVEAVIPLEAIGVELPMAEVYEGIEFPPPLPPGEGYVIPMN